MIKKLLVLVTMAVFFIAMTGNAIAARGSSELDTEKIAVTFAKEVDRGGYKIVSTEDSSPGSIRKKTC